MRNLAFKGFSIRASLSQLWFYLRQPKDYPGVAILFVFSLFALGIAARLVFLQVIVADDYAKQAEDARTSVIQIEPKRGTIYDRNGNVLATSVEAKTVYVNPKEVEDADRLTQALVEVLGGSPQDYFDKVAKSNSSFVYIKRKCDVDVAQKLKERKLKGIHFLPDTKRIYPYGQIAGQVVGLVNIDGVGISGLEMYYNDYLKGVPGKRVAEYGRTGIPIPGAVEKDIPAQDGQDIMITLDIGMQEALEKELQDGTRTIGAKDGNALLMDGASGEIFAIASLPYFNPSDLSCVEAGATDIKSITQAFEPGSIMKVPTMMAILEKGILNPESQIYCPASLKADEYYVRDAHDRGAETMTMRQILAHSSNVGTSLCAEKLGFKELYDKIKSYGFNEKSGIDSPGEAQGYLTKQSSWSKIQSYNVSFGQGLSVTPLQMARFYGALTNDGKAATPHFLLSIPQKKEKASFPEKQIIENTAAIPSLVNMMESVVSDGTAKNAQIPGYKVAGKTGTAEYASKDGGYIKGSYNISFVGFLSNSNSHLVCFVGASEVPGERQVTKVFRDIMTVAIERYKISAN